MTKEEAIWYLQPIADSASLPRYAEALNMAISALREQDATDTNVGHKTNADKFRSMTDEELADFFTKLASRQRNAILKQLHEKGLIPEVYVFEIPALEKVAHLKWLREPVEEE